MRPIFIAPNRHTAESYLKQIVEKYSLAASQLAEWMETNISDGLTAFNFLAVPR